MAATMVMLLSLVFSFPNLSATSPNLSKVTTKRLAQTATSPAIANMTTQVVDKVQKDYGVVKSPLLQRIAANPKPTEEAYESNSQQLTISLLFLWSLQ